MEKTNFTIIVSKAWNDFNWSLPHSLFSIPDLSIIKNLTLTNLLNISNWLLDDFVQLS